QRRLSHRRRRAPADPADGSAAAAEPPSTPVRADYASARLSPLTAVRPRSGCVLGLGGRVGRDAGSCGLLRGCLTPVQSVLEFLLVVLGQRRLQDRAAVLAHRVDG